MEFDELDFKWTDTKKLEDEAKALKEQLKKATQKQNRILKKLESVDVNGEKRKAETKVKIILGAYVISSEEILKKFLDNEGPKKYFNEGDIYFIRLFAHSKYPGSFPEVEMPESVKRQIEEKQKQLNEDKLKRREKAKAARDKKAK